MTFYEVAIYYQLSLSKNFIYASKEKAIEKYEEIGEELKKMDILQRRYYGLYIFERPEGVERKSALFSLPLDLKSEPSEKAKEKLKQRREKEELKRKQEAEKLKKFLEGK